MDGHIENEHLIGEIEALGDATRGSLLTTLVQEGPRRVTELAARHDMSLNAVSKHIKVLESAGMVKRRTLGRVHLIQADLGRIQLVDEWSKDFGSIWDMRLDHLSEALDDKINDKAWLVAQRPKFLFSACYNERSRILALGAVIFNFLNYKASAYDCRFVCFN